ncbi:MAG: ATP-binding protein [Bacteroidales bacterium]
MKNSLRNRLLTWFLIFSSLTLLCLLFFNYIYYSKKNKITEIVNSINAVEVKTLETFLLLDDFFAFETSTEQFFVTGESTYLNSFRNSIKEINIKIDEIKKLRGVSSLEVKSELNSMRHAINEYEKILEEMLSLIIKRGFKDYGLEGEMRYFVHILENFTEIDQTKVLSLRRHEKDYIIRNEDQYIDKLNYTSRNLRAEIIQSQLLNSKEKDSIIKVIDEYVLLFNKLVFLDKEIGLKDNAGGYKLQLNQRAKLIREQISSLMISLEEKKMRIFYYLELLYILFFGLIILTSTILSYVISIKITAPLSALTIHISELTKNNFKMNREVVLEKPHLEIEVLYNEFNLMTNMIIEREQERDRAEYALRESELKFRKLAEMLPLSIFEVDENGRFTYVNQTWLNTFGYSKREVENRILLKEILMKFENSITHPDSTSGIEYIAVKKGGQTFHSLVYADKIIENGKYAGSRGIVVDIMERKKYIEVLRHEKRKAEESDRLKSAFLANMSHEIRTPMNAILGFSQLLTDDDNSMEDKTAYIKQIQTSGKLLLNLIDDIIDIAKIESGVLKIAPGETFVNNILDDLNIYCNEILQRENKEKQIQVKVEKATDSPNFAIISDPYRLKQILGNLINNAIKFTDTGQVEYGYRLTRNELIFFVSDTGIGLSEENRKLVFDRFKQVDDGSSRKYGGTGLGLTICKNLIELLGGKIWLESELNKGTTFFFNIPQVNVPPKLFNPPKLEQMPVHPDWRNRRMLIVEDDPANARVIIESLKTTRINYDWVKNGKEALNIIDKSDTFDIVLMDIHMPVMNGYEATKIIKQKYPSLPVIAQTAAAMEGERQKAIEAGFNEYISKPINFNQLKSIMFALMGFEDHQVSSKALAKN